MSTPSGRDKRPASSPLSDDEIPKRSCDDSADSSYLFDPDATIVDKAFLSSTILDVGAAMSIKDELKSALRDPELLDIISKAVAVQVSAQMRSEISDLKKLIAKKDREILLLKDEVDNLEQYSRRNCIRIGPIPESDHENTDDIATAIAKSIGVDIGEAIDRSHRIGKPPSPTDPNPRPIIVKLTSYRFKAAIMKARKKLREVNVTKVVPSAHWPVLTGAANRHSPGSRGTALAPKVFINEDLTRTRASVAAKARQLKRDKKITDTWTRDGVIFVKSLGDAFHRVTTLRELEVLDT
ncbi:uncharacterized protein [Littorina saxatilis]|uniref:uncharacterized protein n=1 Tax=Littorina saxatilis TaxID=31220 RepID=UPI0038B4D9A2